MKMIVIPPRRSPTVTSSAPVTPSTGRTTTTNIIPYKTIDSSARKEKSATQKVAHLMLDVTTEFSGIAKDAAGLVDFSVIGMADRMMLVDEAWDNLTPAEAGWVRKNAKFIPEIMDATSIPSFATGMFLYHTLMYVCHLFDMPEPEDTQSILELETTLGIEFAPQLLACDSVRPELFGDYSLSDHACTRLLVMPLAAAALISEHRAANYMTTGLLPGEAAGIVDDLFEDGIMH